jgi:5-methylcytosine-specific restriction endonuclease McrA
MGCVYCGKGIVGGNGNTKYCSVRCRKKEAERLFRARGKTHRSLTVSTCRFCGIEFRKKTNGNNKGFYCSRKCAFNNSKARFSNRTRQVVPPFMIGKACKVWFGKCETCGEWFTGRQANAVTCKKYDCKQIRTMRRVYGTEKEYGKEYMCPDCGIEHTIEYGDWGHRDRGRRCKECSAKKGRRVSQGKRKARLRGAVRIESIDPLYILRQYRWTCYLCGAKMDPKMYGEPIQKGKPIDLHYPTIDHVIPVSEGGSHTKDNLRACCFGCNIDKGVLPLEKRNEFAGRYTKQIEKRQAAGAI